MTELALAAGERAFPGVCIRGDGFAAYLAHRRAAPSAWPELFLAFACSEGDACALEHFERRYLSAVRPALKHLDPAGAFADEVRQQLRVRFFVGPSPRILDYLGLGSLEGWVRAAAVRLALDLKRRSALDGTLSVEERLAPKDPELQHLESSHGAAFKTAVSEALKSLSSRERAVLKMKVLDGASIDQLSSVYGIHRATAARWVQRIQEALRERTLLALGKRIAGAEEEAQSLVKALMSGIDLSLRRQLASAGAP